VGRRKRRNYRIKRNRPASFSVPYVEPEEPKARDVTPRGRARPLGGHRLTSDSDDSVAWGRPPGFRY